MNRTEIGKMGCDFNIFLKKDLAKKVTSEQRSEGVERTNHSYVLSIHTERRVRLEVQAMTVGVCSG